MAASRRAPALLTAFALTLGAACGGSTGPTGPDNPLDPGSGPSDPGTGGTTNPPAAPALPPTASLLADLSPLLPAPSGAAGSGAASGAAGAAADGAHWTTAVLRAGNVRGGTSGEVAVHARTLVAAASATPTWADGVHRWRYQLQENGGTRDVTLTARRENGEVTWRMEVVASGSSGAATGLWLDGTAREDGSQGVWRAYDEAGQEEGVRVTVTWTRVSAQEFSATFQAAGSASESVGPWMKLTRNGTARRVDGRDSLLIQWDVQAVAGFLQSPTVNGGLRICWDGQRQDVGCS